MLAWSNKTCKILETVINKAKIPGIKNGNLSVKTESVQESDRMYKISKLLWQRWEAWSRLQDIYMIHLSETQNFNETQYF